MHSISAPLGNILPPSVVNILSQPYFGSYASKQIDINDMNGHRVSVYEYSRLVGILGGKQAEKQAAAYSK